MAGRILFVEDDLSLGENLCEIACISGYDAVSVPCAEEALAVIATNKVDLIVTDYRLLSMSGCSLFRLSDRAEGGFQPWWCRRGSQKTPPKRHGEQEQSKS